jgi:dTDP-4-amino-4,6-dideoxygalactose transaminase
MTQPDPIYVTRPDLPPLAEFLPYLEQIWESRVLTNGGPFHKQLEAALADYLGVPHISLFCNATIALVTALQSQRITGEVITTPYSFVATAHSLRWNGINPVFADVDPVTLNLDPVRIEAAITPQTTAIMPVHCYGTPCDVEAIQRIADDYNLKVIYDAAHAFGVQRQDGDQLRSVLAYGDLSVLSFHATKVFNTFEGGAIISPDAKTKQRIDHLKNFGFANETTVVATGINGKMSEFNAALGLMQLKHVQQAIDRRAAVDARYRAGLGDLDGLRLMQTSPDATPNHSYFPVLVESAFPVSRDALYQRLREHNVLTRRYFYPLISDFPMYRGLTSSQPSNLPVARRAAEQVLCLPIYPGLEEADQQRIIDIVRAAAQGRQPGPIHAVLAPVRGVENLSSPDRVGPLPLPQAA